MLLHMSASLLCYVVAIERLSIVLCCALMNCQLTDRFPSHHSITCRRAGAVLGDRGAQAPLRCILREVQGHARRRPASAGQKGDRVVVLL